MVSIETVFAVYLTFTLGQQPLPNLNTWINFAFIILGYSLISDGKKHSGNEDFKISREHTPEEYNL